MFFLLVQVDTNKRNQEIFFLVLPFNQEFEINQILFFFLNLSFLVRWCREVWFPVWMWKTKKKLQDLRGSWVLLVKSGCRRRRSSIAAVEWWWCSSKKWQPSRWFWSRILDGSSRWRWSLSVMFERGWYKVVVVGLLERKRNGTKTKAVDVRLIGIFFAVPFQILVISSYFLFFCGLMLENEDQ